MTAMGKRSVEKKLRKTSARLRTLRDELVVIDEQLAHLIEDADEKAFEPWSQTIRLPLSNTARQPGTRKQWRTIGVTSSPRSIPSKPVRTSCSMNFAYSD